MIFQSAMGANVAESVFRSVVSGVTKTSTVAALYKGEPAVLSTATIGVGPLGQEVVRALTSTTVGNAAVVGAVYSDTIPHESVGLVQVYGIATVRLAEVATVAAGDRIIADVNSTATALAAYGGSCWRALTATDVRYYTVCNYGAVIMAAATAVSGTNSYTNGTAFIRCL